MRKRDFEMKEGQRFGFRKYLGVGLCAVTLGTFFVTNETTVKADTASDNDAGAKSELVQEKADSNTEQQPASTNTNVQNGKDTAPQTSTVTDNANVQETADKDTQQLQVETKTAAKANNPSNSTGTNINTQSSQNDISYTSLNSDKSITSTIAKEETKESQQGKPKNVSSNVLNIDTSKTSQKAVLAPIFTESKVMENIDYDNGTKVGADGFTITMPNQVPENAYTIVDPPEVTKETALTHLKFSINIPDGSKIKAGQVLPIQIDFTNKWTGGYSSMSVYTTDHHNIGSLSGVSSNANWGQTQNKLGSGSSYKPLHLTFRDISTLRDINIKFVLDFYTNKVGIQDGDAYTDDASMKGNYVRGTKDVQIGANIFDSNRDIKLSYLLSATKPEVKQNSIRSDSVISIIDAVQGIDGKTYLKKDEIKKYGIDTHGEHGTMGIGSSSGIDFISGKKNFDITITYNPDFVTPATDEKVRDQLNDPEIAGFTESGISQAPQYNHVYRGLNHTQINAQNNMSVSHNDIKNTDGTVTRTYHVKSIDGTPFKHYRGNGMGVQLFHLTTTPFENIMVRLPQGFKLTQDKSETLTQAIKDGFTFYDNQTGRDLTSQLAAAAASPLSISSDGQSIRKGNLTQILLISMTTESDPKNLVDASTVEGKLAPSTLKFIDDDDENTILDTDATSGYVGDNINFIKYSSDLSKYKNEGYLVVSDDFNGTGKFVKNGSNYEVHLKHNRTTSAENKTIHQKITYVYEDGSQAAPTYEKDISFSRTNTTDEVTHKTTNGAWTPVEGEFVDVTSPTIENYTPDIPVVKGEKVTADSSDYISQVIYKRKGNPQTSDTPKPTPTPQPSQPTQPTTPTTPSQPTSVPKPTQPTQPSQTSNPEPVPPTSHHEKSTPKPTRNWSNNNAPHSENPSWNSNVTPHGQKTTWNNNGGIHYEHVDSHDSITETKKQTNNQTKFDKENYTLPQTGSDQTSNKTSVILGGIAAAIGMLGLIGVKKRKHN